MRFTDTFIKMNSCVVGATVGRPFCVIKFAIVYENFGVATGGRRLRDWSSLLLEWNVFMGDHWSPICVIEIQ